MLDVKWYEFRAQWPNLRVHMSGRILSFKNGRYLTDDPTEAKHLGKRKGVTLVGTHDRNPVEALAEAVAAAPTADKPENPEPTGEPGTPNVDDDRPIE